MVAKFNSKIHSQNTFFFLGRVRPKNEVFYFYYCVQKFCACEFLWINFFAFFLTDSNAASNFAFHDPHIEFLPNKILVAYISFLPTLKPNADEMAEKTKNLYLINVS
jgi:hypothetical protein